MISGIDHIVLTVSDIDRAQAFYQRVLDMTPVTFAGDRKAVVFGAQKFNFQTLGQETRNRAAVGSGDVCVVTDWPLDRVMAHLAALNVRVLEGPVEKSGAKGTIVSVYINDPDGNLIEISHYADEAHS